MDKQNIALINDTQGQNIGGVFEPSPVEGDYSETMMEERMEMESKQELDRVQQMNKVSNVIRPTHPMGTKLARNLLTKITTGPLGRRSSEASKAEESEDESRTSEEKRYEQRLAHMHAMKETQQEELDTLRQQKIVQTKLADRRTKSRANHMFNRRLFVKPSAKRSRRNKGGILVTGIEQENDAVSVEYFRQESQLYVSNFFRNPSHNRRVLQRLNSEQIRGISDIELRKAQARRRSSGPSIAEENFVGSSVLATGQFDPDDVEVDGNRKRPKVPQEQNSTAEWGQSSKVKPVQGSPQKDKWWPSLKRKHRGNEAKDGGHSSPSTLSKLGRKIKGGLKKSYKNKSHKPRHASSSMDEMLDDVTVKRRKKSVERKLVRQRRAEKQSRTSSKNSTSSSQAGIAAAGSPVDIATAFGVMNGQVEMSIPIRAQSPASPSVSVNKLVKASQQISDSSEMNGTSSPLSILHLESEPFGVLPSKDRSSLLSDVVPQHASGPPSPYGASSPVDSESESHSIPASPLDYMPPLRMSEDDIEAGYLSESESGTFSEDEPERSSDELLIRHESSSSSRVQREVLERRAAINEGGPETGQDLDSPDYPHSQSTRIVNGELDVELQGGKSLELVSDLHVPQLSKMKRFSEKASSQDSNMAVEGEESQYSRAPHYKRYFSSPHLSTDASFDGGHHVVPLHPSTLFTTHTCHTPHGYYNTAVVEVNPFSVEFDQGVEEKSLQEAKILTKTVSHSRQTSLQHTDSVQNGSFETFETSFNSQETSLTQLSVNKTYGANVLTPKPAEPGSQIPAQAFKDPKFLEFIKTLNHEPNRADYICYQLRVIGDGIDVKYDKKLNGALDDIFMEAVKNNVSWETFSSISKRLLLEGQRIQDGIFMITCFGRRLAEMTPQLGDRVTGFTHRVLDTYASDFIWNSGGWGQLVQSYNQVEVLVSPGGNEFDYEENGDDGYLPAGPDWIDPGRSWYDDDSQSRPHIPTLSPLRETNSFDDPLLANTLPIIVTINPFPDCVQNTLQEEKPHPYPSWLQRAVSVEVLFNEPDDATEHAQNDYHDNTHVRTGHSLTRSLSASSIDIGTPAVCCHGSVFSRANGSYHSINDSILGRRSPSPTKAVSEIFSIQESHVEESSSSYYNFNRRGSNASVCSTSSIRIVHFPNGDHFTDVDGGRVEIVGKGGTRGNRGLDLPLCTPSGDYLDLDFDTPHPSRSNTMIAQTNSDNSSKGKTELATDSRLSSLAVPLATVAIVTGVVVLGFWLYRRNR